MTNPNREAKEKRHAQRRSKTPLNTSQRALRTRKIMLKTKKHKQTLFSRLS